MLMLKKNNKLSMIRRIGVLMAEFSSVGLLLLLAVILLIRTDHGGLITSTTSNSIHHRQDQQHTQEQNHHLQQPHKIISTTTTTLTISHHRKLLNQKGEELKIEPNRMWGERCSKSDIVVSQGSTPPLPNGIPTYTVEIMNVCTKGCDISNIHLSCGWFSSARLINPRVFKRIRYNDCILNNGEALINGDSISFQYANTFQYPLTVSSVNC
ncbi:hypothetical protein C5167_007003 [Papaver somniferum]|uniref:Uncharacterized protein n=1 Tax=Papaver somniferum TaxID=3469 RepID=A0A4Y7JI15_PAPSO|nr:protein TAPETUM DETERMINANT 1-like [Papaver somniferum]RZC59702.1 hypothetical protein C5167_007003 [Papaver somniferum]